MSSDRCRERVRALVADPQFSSRRSLGRFDWRMSPWRAAIKVGQYVLAGRHVDRDAIIANVVDGLSDACMLSGATEVMDHGALPYVARVVCDSANGMVHAYRCKDCNGRDMTLMLVDGTVPSRVLRSQLLARALGVWRLQRRGDPLLPPRDGGGRLHPQRLR